MKLKQPILKLSFAAILGAAVLSSCGKKDDSSDTADSSESAATAPSATAPAATPARADLPVKKLEVTASDLMKFNIEKLDAQANQKIELIFKNVGTMPKQSMGHNFCLLHLKVDPAAFLEAGFASAGNDYVAKENEKDVITRTKILGPGESETLSFTAPSAPGAYEYVCTFPGHFGAGMHGFLTITE